MKAHAIGAATALALLLAACGGTQVPGDRDIERARTQPGATLASAYAPGPANAPVEHDSAGRSFPEDDLKAFGYASNDLVTLDADLTAITSTLESLNANAASRDLESLSRDATTLRELADALESSASKSAGRLSGLGPLDQGLQKAWVDGIEAFTDTASYASSASDVANSAMTLDVGELRTVVEKAAAMEGTTSYLANSYSSLTKELERWALENPHQAAAALARYGG
jgi:hypothetical protein